MFWKYCWFIDDIIRFRIVCASFWSNLVYKSQDLEKKYIILSHFYLPMPDFFKGKLRPQYAVTLCIQNAMHFEFSKSVKELSRSAIPKTTKNSEFPLIPQILTKFDFFHLRGNIS